MMPEMVVLVVMGMLVTEECRKQRDLRHFGVTTSTNPHPVILLSPAPNINCPVSAQAVKVTTN